MPKSRFNLLLLIPPALFVGFATVGYIGLTRDNPDELPSALQDRSAPGLELTTQLRDDPAPSNAVLTEPGVKLVNFWASWCGPCRVEHPYLAEIADMGIPIIGVNYKDQPANALSFLEELGDFYTYVGADTTGRTALDWGIYGVPETFVIDGDGTVLLRFPGPVTGSVLENRIMPVIQAAQAGG